ncbi:MAG: hypothetical protein L3J45_03120 [Flavobacteriaceae bacterium]|nr:hypothetical protein [Flavobacteriaceae bacterium]
MKRFIKIIKVLFVSGLVVFLYGFSANRNAQNRIKNISIKIENDSHLFLTKNTVNKMLKQKLTSLKTQSKEALFLNDLEATLRANALVENAEVFRNIKGDLGVIIKQKTPLARVMGNKEVFYIDSKGGKMPLSKNYSANVPLVSGITNEEALDSVYKLLLFIHTDAFFKKQIIGINKNENNEFELSTRLGNALVLFGHLENLQGKLNNLKAYYLNAIQNKSVNRYKKINLKYSNQVVCTK